MRFTKHISIACALLAVLAVATPAASASPSQIDFFEAPQQLLSSGGRSPAFQQLTGLGVRAIRIQLIWDEVAPKPNSRTKPNVNLANPASYNWGQYLYAIQQAQLLNWTVLLTVTGAAPCWASACATTPTKHETKRQKLDAIVTNPNATDYGKFLRAVGSKFGSYVKLYSIWNEPNQPQFLLPQYAAHHRLLSPSIYRRLFLAGYKGLRASGNFTRMKVLMGETSPVGGFSDISTPLAFMRGVLCLNSSYRKTSSCGRLPAAGYAQHPYDQRQGPYWVPPAYAGGKDDVTMATLGQLATALDRAAAAGAIRSHLPIYITEYGVQSYPNHGLGVPALQQAEYDAIAEQMAYNDPRVASFDQYLLTDDPIAPEASFQTGIEYTKGKPKPLYAGYRTPLTVTVQGGSKVAFWGLVRPAGGGNSTVTIQYSANKGKTWAQLTTAQTNATGHWTGSGNFVANRVWRVQWTASNGTVYDGPAIRAYIPGSSRPAS